MKNAILAAAVKGACLEVGQDWRQARGLPSLLMSRSGLGFDLQRGVWVAP